MKIFKKLMRTKAIFPNVAICLNIICLIYILDVELHIASVTLHVAAFMFFHRIDLPHPVHRSLPELIVNVCNIEIVNDF